jgi:hypothetical protein
MNTQQIFTSIPYEQLLNDLTERITQAIPPVQVLPPPTQEHTNDLITRKETASLLGITLPTLRTWSLDGRLKAYYINTRVRYKRGEVLQSLKHSKH